MCWIRRNCLEPIELKIVLKNKQMSNMNLFEISKGFAIKKLLGASHPIKIMKDYMIKNGNVLWNPESSATYTDIYLELKWMQLRIIKKFLSNLLFFGKSFRNFEQIHIGHLLVFEYIFSFYRLQTVSTDSTHPYKIF